MGSEISSSLPRTPIVGRLVAAGRREAKKGQGTRGRRGRRQHEAPGRLEKVVEYYDPEDSYAVLLGQHGQDAGDEAQGQ